MFYIIGCLVLIINLGCTGSDRTSETIRRFEELKPEAKNSPLSCAVFVALSERKAVYRTVLLEKIVEKCLEAGLKEKALEIISEALQAAKTIKKARARSVRLRVIVEKYATAGEIDQALEIAKTIEQEFAGSRPMLTIAHAYSQAGQFDQALQIAQTFDSVLYKDAILRGIVKKDKKGEYCGQVLLEAEKMSDSAHKVNTLITIADKFADIGQKENASQILSHALAIAQGLEKLKARTMAEVAAQYAKIGEQEKALEILSKALLEADKDYFKVWTLRVIALAYAQAEDKQMASKIFSQAAQKAAGDHSRLFDVLKNCVEAELFGQALQIARSMRKDSKASAIAMIAKGVAQYAKDGHTDKASELLSQAFQILNTIRDSEAKARALAAIAGAYLEAGQSDRALQFAQSIKNIKRAYLSKVRILIKIADKCDEMGQTDKAYEILSQAQQAANAIAEPHCKVIALIEIADKYAETEQNGKVFELLLQALETAKTIRYTFEKARALADIGIIYAKTRQDVDWRARKILSEIVIELE